MVQPLHEFPNLLFGTFGKTDTIQSKDTIQLVANLDTFGMDATNVILCIRGIPAKIGIAHLTEPTVTGDTGSKVGKVDSAVTTLSVRRNVINEKPGATTVRFRINQTGNPEAIRILKGSGYSILDAAARDTVVKASPFPARNNSVKVPITFTLKDH